MLVGSQQGASTQHTWGEMLYLSTDMGARFEGPVAT
jgi:hypothetical protein